MLQFYQGLTHLKFGVLNTFEQTLDAQAVLQGQIRLVSVRDPTVAKTLSLSVTNIVFAKSYDPRTGNLTIDPGDSVVFDAYWNLAERPLADDNRRDLAKSFFNLQTDPECALRRIAEPEDFVVQSPVTVFEKTAPVATQVILRFCLVSA